MTTTKKDTRDRESYEDCLKRRRLEVKGKTKSQRTDRVLAQQLARADQQRGLCGAPVNG
jgi:hypothetical protein